MNTFERLEVRIAFQEDAGFFKLDGIHKPVLFNLQRFSVARKKQCPKLKIDLRGCDKHCSSWAVDTQPV